MHFSSLPGMLHILLDLIILLIQYHKEQWIMLKCRFFIYNICHWMLMSKVLDLTLHVLMIYCTQIAICFICIDFRSVFLNL
jgi:hypothetical protein